MIERAGVNSTVAYIGAEKPVESPVVETVVEVIAPIVDLPSEQPEVVEVKKKSK